MKNENAVDIYTTTTSTTTKQAAKQSWVVARASSSSVWPPSYTHLMWQMTSIIYHSFIHPFSSRSDSDVEWWGWDEDPEFVRSLWMVEGDSTARQSISEQFEPPSSILTLSIYPSSPPQHIHTIALACVKFIVRTMMKLMMVREERKNIFRLAIWQFKLILIYTFQVMMLISLTNARPIFCSPYFFDYEIWIPCFLAAGNSTKVVWVNACVWVVRG